MHTTSMLAVAACIATAAPVMSTSVMAQAGCDPFVGGSCGYQDTHPPVPWRGQNWYYNDGVRRYGQHLGGTTVYGGQLLRTCTPIYHTRYVCGGRCRWVRWISYQCTYHY